MKVIEICTAKSLGGLELYFATCCRKLKSMKHEVLAIVEDDTKLYQLLKEEIDYRTLSSSFFGSFFYLRKIIKDFHPDIIHVHHKKDLLLVSVLKRFSSTKFTFVHTRQMDQPRNKKNPYHTFIYRSIDLIIAITDRLKDQIIQHINVNPNKVVRLYYGVPLPKRELSRCSEIGTKDGHFNIGVIARIDHKKEQKVIIESLKLLVQNNISKIHVYLVGDSTDDSYLSEIKQLISDYKLVPHITLTGFVKDPQELMGCFHTIVLTTGNETFGLVLPEAMRMGVPVIGAKGGGVPEIIDHNESGLMFKPGNAKDLGEQIQAMMIPETRERLSKNGKIKADKMFEIESHFLKLEKLMAKSLV